MTTLVLQRPYLVERLEEIALKRNTTPETLLDTAVQEFLERAEPQSSRLQRAQAPKAPPEFLREIEAFERLKPELLKEYKGRVVAIYQGKVVAVGDNKLTVHGEVIEKFGPVLCYVEWVEEVTPRKARIVSTWKAERSLIAKSMTRQHRFYR